MPRCPSSLHIQQSVGRLQSRASWPILSQYCHNLILHRHLISDRHRDLTITNFHLSNENYIAHEQKKLTKIALSKVNKTHLLTSLRSEAIHETGLSGNVVASFFPLIIFILLCFNVLSSVPRENRLADFRYIYKYQS